jgi:hypothetical protein
MIESSVAEVYSHYVTLSNVYDFFIPNSTQLFTYTCSITFSKSYLSERKIKVVHRNGTSKEHSVNAECHKAQSSAL